jgi:hypothetical protein
VHLAENHTSKDALPIAEQNEGYEGRFTQFEDCAVSFETIPAGMDYGPFVKGLPDDACQCPHWGYCFKGRFIIRYTDGHQETVEAGEAYYMPPGHVPRYVEDTETLEFSPKAALDKTMEVVQRNMAGMQP